MGVLGERSESVLSHLLDLIEIGSSSNLVCNPLQLNYLFHSIDGKREIDRGVFIKQDLPNLGR